MSNAKRQMGVTGTPITPDCSLGTRKNVLQLTSGLFVGFLFVTQTVSLAACSFWNSLQTQAVFLSPWCIFLSSLMSQPANLWWLSLVDVTFFILRCAFYRPLRVHSMKLAGHVTLSSSFLHAFVMPLEKV